MTPILLFAGILLLLVGLAGLPAGQAAASSSRLREHSRSYAIVNTAAGVVLLIVAIVRMTTG